MAGGAYFPCHTWFVLPTSRRPSPPRLFTYLALSLIRMLDQVGALWDGGCLACWVLPRLMAASLHINLTTRPRKWAVLPWTDRPCSCTFAGMFADIFTSV